MFVPIAGYKYMFDEKLVTVWSAPNYCYRCGNIAAVLTFSDPDTREAKLFRAVPEHERVIPARTTTPYFLQDEMTTMLFRMQTFRFPKFCKVRLISLNFMERKHSSHQRYDTEYIKKIKRYSWIQKTDTLSKDCNTLFHVHLSQESSFLSFICTFL